MTAIMPQAASFGNRWFDDRSPAGLPIQTGGFASLLALRFGYAKSYSEQRGVSALS